ncbi:MAG: sigma-54 dependent transcriptional regulator [Candidatus Marinimicrobia bacterium]|nr:sigma-54 dependent transcriptional regulator [Candidatus Neomarinimicrobiota bacterium]
MKKLIHIVDDEAFMRQNIIDALSSQKVEFIESSDGLAAIEVLESKQPNLLLLDINLPGMDGLSVLKKARILHPQLPIIMLTAHGTSERAIRAMKNGAFDYLEKPFELEEFLLIVERALEYSDLINEIQQLRSERTRDSQLTGNEIVGRSEGMQEVFKLIGKVAMTNAPVLIEGESGTGKELIADAIQRHSDRKSEPYIKVNCGALPETLLESEIFGHEKGAYTGAHSRVMGRFELAHGGTILLDELNSMPLSLQVKLLRVLETGTFERLGGEKSVQANVRVLAITNRDAEYEVAHGHLREDLFYRLNVVRIIVPPLRKRLDDLPLLMEHFIHKYSPTRKVMISPETIEKSRDYDWPGNVRELENTIRSHLVLTQGNVLSFDKTDSAGKAGVEGVTQENLNFKERISALERELILSALYKSGDNKAMAARLLGINRRLLYSKISEYEIEL